MGDGLAYNNEAVTEARELVRMAIFDIKHTSDTPYDRLISVSNRLAKIDMLLAPDYDTLYKSSDDAIKDTGADASRFVKVIVARPMWVPDDQGS